MAKFQGISGGTNLRVQQAAVARTDTTAAIKFILPKGARIIGFVLSGTASNAGTTATISVGSTSGATEYVNAHDVKTVATGSGVVLMNGVASGVGAALTGATNPVYVKYAETGAASNAGAWKLFCVYTDGNLQAYTDLA